MFLFLPLTQKITSSAHWLHLLPYLLAIPECVWLSPASSGRSPVSFLYHPPEGYQLTPGVKQGSLMFAELHSDARVRPKLASEEFSGCGQLFHSASTYFRTEPGAVLDSGGSVIKKAHIGQIVTELQL